jgi:23S rRNA-/tRNA-specific pseudouridylate synthase
MFLVLWGASMEHGIDADVFCFVDGVCYVKPYMNDRIYSVRMGSEGQSVAIVLANAFKRGSQAVEVAREHFEKEVLAARVFLERHKETRDDVRPFTAGFEQVTDANMVTERGDRIKIARHVHERVFALNRPGVEVLWRSQDDFVRVVNKPAGVPVVDEGEFHDKRVLCFAFFLFAHL